MQSPSVVTKNEELEGVITVDTPGTLNSVHAVCLALQQITNQSVNIYFPRDFITNVDW